MSRRGKSGNIPVEVIEVKGSKEDELNVEVHVHGESIGRVAQTSEKQVTAFFESGREQFFPSLNDGVEAILREYNLHN